LEITLFALSQDMRTNDIILSAILRPEILNADFVFDHRGVYYSLNADRRAPKHSYLEYVETLPHRDEPDLFGFHENAAMSCDLNEV